MDTEHRAQARARAREKAAELTAQGIVGTALTWVDNAGLTRVKAVPTARLEHAAQWGVGMSPVFDVFLVDDSITTSRHIGGPDGDLRLFPDLDRLTPLAAQPRWAWAPADRYDMSGREHPACQRLFAHRMAERARERGLGVLMGIETEWVVATADAQESELRYPTAGPAYGMSRLVDLSDYLADVLDALQAQRVEVLQIHPEYSPGQFEVSVAPADPVGAADLAVLVRQTIRGVSAQHGLTPSFAPVFTPDTVGNGGHLHLSLWQDERDLCRDGDGPCGMT
ncbi:glutamine synthetase, partial [Streptomyces sp. 2MCAF27]